MAPRLRATAAIVAAAGVVTALAAVASASVLGARGVATVVGPRLVGPVTGIYHDAVSEPTGKEETADGEPAASSAKCSLPLAACTDASATVAAALASNNQCFAHDAAAQATLHAAAATLDANVAAGCCEASPELLKSLKAVVALDTCLPPSLPPSPSWILPEDGSSSGGGLSDLVLTPAELYDTCCAGFAPYLTACCSDECFSVAMLFGNLFPLEDCCGPLINGYADPDHPEQAPLAPASACTP